MSDSPLVSVYMPTRNRAELAWKAARSVLIQSYPELELIIVDDASDPPHGEVLGRLAEGYPGRVTLLRNQTRQGACFSRNLAIAAASGHFVTGLDDDDRFLPDRIARFVEAWKVEDSFLFDDDFLEEDGCEAGIWRKKRAALHRLLSYNCIGNQVFTTKAKLEGCGGFDPTLPAAQDYDMWVRLTLAHGEGRHLSGATQVITRDRARPRISLSSKTWIGYWRVYQKHRHILSRSQRKNRLTAILRARGRHFSPRLARVLLTPSNARGLLTLISKQ